MLQAMTLAIVLLLYALSQSSDASAADRQQLIPLQRVTVGPFDNYQPGVDSSGKNVYFTRAQNLSSQIMRLDLKSGLSEALTPPDADAKSPVVSPNGKLLAFTYYKFDAKGDICLLEEGEKEIRCITKTGEVDQNPFWVDDEHLAYVTSNDAGNINKLFIRDLKQKEKSAKPELLMQGSFYTPAMAPGGKQLVYKGKANELVLFDVPSKKVARTLTMNLPGASGPARFSADGRYLYFAQYIADTNKDLFIDARDAAAIYRVDLQESGQGLAQQLTSLQQNCSEPLPSRQHLYLTCAFEGALDIYQSPLEGTVPVTWNAKDLWGAHMAARSYADRVLLLNQLYVRFKSMPEAEYNDRNLMNFILMEAYLPAQYYAQKLAGNTNAEEQRAAMELALLDTYARWEILPQKRNLGRFAEHLKEQETKLQAYGKNPMAQVSLSYLQFFANESEKSRQILAAIKTDDARVLYWKTHLEARLERSKNPENYRKSLAKNVLTPNLSEQTRLYYLALWFEELQAKEPKAFLADFGGQIDSYPMVKELFENEQELYQHTHSPDDKTANVEYRKIVERVRRIKDEYFPLRLLFNRSLISMSRAKKTKDMADIVSLWLSYLKRDTKEYPYAIEAMRRNTLDVAYRFYHANTAEKAYAGGAFYNSIRASDDLESHYQYTLLNLDPARWKELESTYKIMIKDGLVRRQSLEFVRIVRSLQKNPKELESSDFEEAATQVETLPEDYVGLGTKFLLLGYLYQMQMIKDQKGFKFDRDLADKAHRAYLFAIDAAYANNRIMSAALQNIAILHLNLRNFSMAAEFFAERQKLPMNSQAQATANLWLMAGAMYRSYRAEEAFEAMKKAAAFKAEPRAAFLEKTAFYAWNAQNFQASVQAYDELLALGIPQRAGIYLSYGYALRGIGRSADAETALNKALALAKQEKTPASESGLDLVYQPLKVRFTALGLLARTQLPPAKQKTYLEERLSLFPEIIGKAKSLHFSEETLRSQQVKETQDLALLEAASGAADAAQRTLLKSFALTQKHGEDFGFLAHTVMISAKNGMLLMQDKKWQNPAVDAQLAEIIKASDSAYRDQKNPGGVVTQKWGELRLVYSAYKLRQQGNRREQFASSAASMLSEEPFQNLAKDQPLIHEALAKYQKGIERNL